MALCKEKSKGSLFRYWLRRLRNTFSLYLRRHVQTRVAQFLLIRRSSPRSIIFYEIKFSSNPIFFRQLFFHVILRRFRTELIFFFARVDRFFKFKDFCQKRKKKFVSIVFIYKSTFQNEMLHPCDKIFWTLLWNITIY